MLAIHIQTAPKQGLGIRSLGEVGIIHRLMGVFKLSKVGVLANRFPSFIDLPVSYIMGSRFYIPYSYIAQ